MHGAVELGMKSAVCFPYSRHANSENENMRNVDKKTKPKEEPKHFRAHIEKPLYMADFSAGATVLFFFSFLLLLVFSLPLCRVKKTVNATM